MNEKIDIFFSNECPVYAEEFTPDNLCIARTIATDTPQTPDSSQAGVTYIYRTYNIGCFENTRLKIDPLSRGIIDPYSRGIIDGYIFLKDLKTSPLYQLMTEKKEAPNEDELVLIDLESTLDTDQIKRLLSDPDLLWIKPTINQAAAPLNPAMPSTTDLSADYWIDYYFEKVNYIGLMERTELLSFSIEFYKRFILMFKTEFTKPDSFLKKILFTLAIESEGTISRVIEALLKATILYPCFAVPIMIASSLMQTLGNLICIQIVILAIPFELICAIFKQDFNEFKEIAAAYARDAKKLLLAIPAMLASPLAILFAVAVGIPLQVFAGVISECIHGVHALIRRRNTRLIAAINPLSPASDTPALNPELQTLTIDIINRATDNYKQLHVSACGLFKSQSNSSKVLLGDLENAGLSDDDKKEKVQEYLRAEKNKGKQLWFCLHQQMQPTQPQQNEQSAARNLTA